jgi:hypothetical protein
MGPIDTVGLLDPVAHGPNQTSGRPISSQGRFLKRS